MHSAAVAVAFRSGEKVFWRRGHSMIIFAPPLIHTLADLAEKPKHMCGVFGSGQIKELTVYSNSIFKTSFTRRIDYWIACCSFVLYLKLTCHHINRRNICFNIKSISVHPLFLMNVMLDSICMVFAELLSTGYKRKIQNYNVCLRRESNQRHLAFQRVSLNHSAIGAVDEMWIKLLQYNISKKNMMQTI